MINEFQQLIYTVLPTNPNKAWFRILVVLGILLLIIIWYKRIDIYTLNEGFRQDSRFVLKRDDAIYDEFYVELYNKIHQPEKQCAFIVENVVSMTQPSKKSVMLDVGSGTGQLTNALHTSGYVVYGIDKSQAMVDYCENRYPDVPVKCGDITVPMTYDRNTFSHVLCCGMMIYQFADKAAFFRNCYYWLVPNGYLVLHLVDRSKFDTIIPAGKPPLLDESPQKYAEKRITSTDIDFSDFKYKSSYDFSKKDTATLTETMTDSANSVRQNELTLYMEDYNDILRIAQKNGFIVHGQVNLLECIGDEHQYFFVLERPL